jgi:hypothetical protein
MTENDFIDLYELKNNFEKHEIFDRTTLQNWNNRFRLLYLTTPEIQQKLGPLHRDLVRMQHMVEGALILHKINEEAAAAIQSSPNDQDPVKLRNWGKTYVPLIDQIFHLCFDMLENTIIDVEENSVQFTVEDGYHTNPPQESPPETADWGDWVVIKSFTLKCELAPVEASIKFADLYYQNIVEDEDEGISDFMNLN